jgi:hypothetical protein
MDAEKWLGMAAPSCLRAKAAMEALSCHKHLIYYLCSTAIISLSHITTFALITQTGHFSYIGRRLVISPLK